MWNRKPNFVKPVIFLIVLILGGNKDINGQNSSPFHPADNGWTKQSKFTVISFFVVVAYLSLAPIIIVPKVPDPANTYVLNLKQGGFSTSTRGLKIKIAHKCLQNWGLTTDYWELLVAHTVLLLTCMQWEQNVGGKTCSANLWWLAHSELSYCSVIHGLNRFFRRDQ